MKKLTRDRVVPIISASVSWLIFVMIGSGLSSLPKFASSRSRQPHDDGVCHRHGRCHPVPLSGQTSFSEEIIRTKNCNDGFLTNLRNDGDLYLATLDVEDCIRRMSLGEDDLRFRVRMDAPAIANLGEKRFRIEGKSTFDRHSTSFSTARL